MRVNQISSGAELPANVVVVKEKEISLCSEKYLLVTTGCSSFRQFRNFLDKFERFVCQYIDIKDKKKLLKSL